MVRKVYSKEEFIEKVNMDESRLDVFIKAQILKPAGKVDGSNPYFDESSVDVVEAISKLLELGYDEKEVIRIRQKVGLPGKAAVDSKKDKTLLTVGELAKRLGSNPRTIKHWEEKGIIEPDSHSPGGFRLYEERFVQVCMLLQDLQNFGYTLDEIKVIADLFRDFLAVKDNLGVFPADRVQEKLVLMTEQIGLVNDKMKVVETGIKRWRKILKQHQKQIAALSGQLAKQLKKKSMNEKNIQKGQNGAAEPKAARKPVPV
ncbi:MAG: MerR family transcriptional regulator [Pseudomonadota bacterium]